MAPASLHIQLLQAKNAAEAARRAKSDFLENWGHEVREAMQSIIGMTDSVLATELNPEQRRDLSVVKESANSLLKIIDEMLDYLKIEEG